MSKYRVLDEKFTRPTNLEQDLSRYLSKIVTKLLPTIKYTTSKDIIQIIKEEHEKFKQEIEKCTRTKDSCEQSPVSVSCEALKKLRLTDEIGNTVAVASVQHISEMNLKRAKKCPVDIFGDAVKKVRVMDEKRYSTHTGSACKRSPVDIFCDALKKLRLTDDLGDTVAVASVQHTSKCKESEGRTCFRDPNCSRIPVRFESTGKWQKSAVELKGNAGRHVSFKLPIDLQCRKRFPEESSDDEASKSLDVISVPRRKIDFPKRLSLLQGYFQPAGPLISVPHGHTQQQQPLGKSAPLSETSPSVSPPPTHQPPAPSSAGDSSDNDVIITSVTSAKDASPPQPPSQPYRLNQYPSTHTGYAYGYPPHYYHAPPPAPAYSHHDLCYPQNPYLHHKTYPPAYRHRYLGPPTTAQYYQANPPDLYNPPPAASQQNQQVVTATPTAAASVSGYQPTPSGPPPPTLLDTYAPPPPTLMETYPPPPHYYPGYGPAPPACYSHSPTRTLPYINAAYQSCPCPMQSCPKNVHTGPLIGDNKRSNISSITKDSVLLPPVALALPLEPASATGPPSPARGSAGMPPPPSPAGATYQAPPTPKRETPEPADKRRKARVGKAVVRNNLHAQNTMLLMCHEPAQNPYLNGVKREVESPKEEQKKEALSAETIKSKFEPTVIEPIKVSTPPTVVQEKEVEAPTLTQQVLKVEESEPDVSKEAPKPPDPADVMEPCINTVAENFKMKNMKRKPSINKAEEVSPPPKKQKLEKIMPNGSYKDLIKKSFTSVHINNGKRKLLEKTRNLLNRNTRIRLKKPTTKRKLSPLKEEGSKKFKLSRPLIASNLHNSKQNLKETKDQSFVDSELIENKEPTKIKKSVNSKFSAKKFAPAILDSLFAKNNVDRTIERVISDGGTAGVARTQKNGANPLRTSVEKPPKVEVKKEPVVIVVVNKKFTNSKIAAMKSKIECRKVGAAKRKSKCKSVEVVPQAVTRVPRRSLQLPRWSNGWTWKGEPFEAKVFLNSDEATLVRRCYPAMRHEEGDVIETRDCVLLKAGQRKNELPFVAKIAALWENPEDGEMMMSLLWYYRPEHTEQGRLPFDQPDEVFASRHKDSNSVACIEDKCYVLTFNEYCRYRKNLRRLEEGLEDTSPCIPIAESYPRLSRQPPMSIVTSADLVFFCRRVYDFRQKRIVKNPS